MENYIESHDDDKKTIMKEYKEMRLISDCHSVRYPVVKNWFLDKYPKIKQFGMPKPEEETVAAEGIPFVGTTKVVNKNAAA